MALMNINGYQSKDLVEVFTYAQSIQDLLKTHFARKLLQKILQLMMYYIKSIRNYGNEQADQAYPK